MADNDDYELDELAGQIALGAVDAHKRHAAFVAQHPDSGMQAVVSAYLTGALQALHHVVARDGELTAQRMEKAVTLAAQKLGCSTTVATEAFEIPDKEEAAAPGRSAADYEKSYSDVLCPFPLKDAKVEVTSHVGATPSVAQVRGLLLALRKSLMDPTSYQVRIGRGVVVTPAGPQEHLLRDAGLTFLLRASLGGLQIMGYREVMPIPPENADPGK